MFVKKSSAVLFATGFILSTNIALAEAPNKNTANSLMKNSNPHFELSAAVLALKPSASNLNYVIYNKALPLQSPGWTEQEIRPEYSLSFELAGRYRLPENKDIHLNWVHLNSNTSAAVTAPNSQYFLGPDYEIGPNASNIRNATGKALFKYDVINLDAGQSILFDEHTGMRLFGGLSNGYLREQVNATYSGNTVTGLYQGPFSTQQEVTANYTGIGPRIGIDADYTADCGIGLIGQAAASLLVGSAHSKTSYISSAQELRVVYGQSQNFQTIADQTFIQVIPGFDAKLGLDYKHKFKNQANLILEAGYDAAVYLNVINQYLPATLVTNQDISTGGIFVATMSHTQSNYSVQGPFLKATVQF